MNTQNLPHTAAATWSGFIYQGKVALYHVMKLIAEKTKAELDALHLQIDSLEDFAIVNVQRGNTIPVTIHQVKAVNSHLYSTYEDAFEQLEQKKRTYGMTGDTAYFHLCVENDYTPDAIEHLHPTLKIYCYKSDGFCPLTEIDNKIRSMLVEALQKHNIPGSHNDNNVRILSELAEKKIVDRVIYIHSLNHGGIKIADAAFDNPICLSEFLDEISKDLTADILDEKFFERRIKMDLNRYYQDFCVNYDAGLVTNEIQVKMDNYLYLLNSYQGADFKSFIQSIRPHKSISYDSLEGYTDCLSDDEIKDAFLEILMIIKESNNNRRIGWTCAGNKHYYPTSINYSNSPGYKKKASERILKTILNKDIDLPFNSDYLITSECNVDDLEACANHIGCLNADSLSGDAQRRNKITQWKKVSLIDLETAKNILNND
ncbi:ABC-three component system protein [Chitinophaga sp. Cy-1792]|uniref:ABC-three component system protein n=1 Tax=Chitinophaga sp. Cy-1792 TaxID=2608339 RepID=UPI001422E329|nr:ABC-three component system protein [Chitinophaga sp. Cy-1792]NIG54866.1 hypothetical protein [Chitinophaga sp. Cy-1792]